MGPRTEERADPARLTMTAAFSQLASNVDTLGEPAQADVACEETNCLLCGADDAEPVVVGHDCESPTGAQYRVVRCRQCGLGYTNPRPTPADIGRCYPTDYGCHQARPQVKTRERGRLCAELERAALQTYFGYPRRSTDRSAAWSGRLGKWWIRGPQRRGEWFEFHGEGRLLDFGCGAGTFLERMQNYGWRVEGVEVSARVAADVGRRTGIRVHAGSLPHDDLHGRRFDVVTMRHSLEHVHAPREVVRAARELLVPQGRLLVTVPNLASWSFERFRKHWFALDVPRHLTHFTPTTLAQLLEREGFRIRGVEHLGNAGWLRHSARMWAASGKKWSLKSTCRWKPPSEWFAWWSERNRCADVFMVCAERT
jgi:2-polyprenyl-3-methyl-5-hydroxy-6-metoxy-1,4-benzoquinol methylase